MEQFCQDRDLLAMEPMLFGTSDSAAQALLVSQDGTINGQALSCPLADCCAAGIEPGMVAAVYADGNTEAAAYEILDVLPGMLTLSVLRASPQQPAITPPPADMVRFHVRTYAAQIRNTSAALAEKLRQSREAAGVRSASFADSAQLRLTAVCGALADIFVARAHNARENDANWVKAQHYRQEFSRLQLSLRLAVDADGDGIAEATRTLGNVTLRRI